MKPARSNATVLSEPVYDALKERIMDQELPPGGRVNIDAIAALLGVSPTPVREALVRLTSERLAVFTPYKGFTVAPLPSARRFAELIDVRRLLEEHASRLAAQRALSVHLRAMERELAGISTTQPAPRFASYAAFNEHDRTFHERLIAASDNDVLLEQYRALGFHGQLARLYHDLGEVDQSSTLREHRAIYEAVRARDPEAAARAVVAHIEAIEERVSTVLQRRLDTLDAMNGERGSHRVRRSERTRPAAHK